MRMSLVLLAVVTVTSPALATVPRALQEDAGIPPVGLSAVPPQSPLLVDTLYSFPGGTTWPSGLAWDGAHFWVGDKDTTRIMKMDSTGAMLSCIDGYDPSGIAFVNGHLWVVVEHLATLYKLDPASGAALDSFRLPDSLSSDPQSWGITWDGTHFWHSQYGGAYPGREKVFKLDPVTLQPVHSFVPAAQRMLAIEWRDSLLCGLEIRLKRLYWIDPETGVFVDSAAWPVPYPLGMTWCHGHLWNASGSSRSTYRGRERVYRTDVLTGIAEQPGEFLPAGTSPPTICRGVLLLASDFSVLTSDFALLDISGRRVLDLRPGPNDIHHLSPGVYFVHSSSDNRHSSFVKKVIVTS